MERYGKYAAKFLLNHYQLIALCRLSAQTRKWKQLGKTVDFVGKIAKTLNEKKKTWIKAELGNETKALF